MKNPRRFLRQYRGRINIVVMLALINLFTGLMSGDFWPWFLIPSFFIIGLPIVQDIVDAVLGDDEEEESGKKQKKKKKETPEDLDERTPAEQSVSVKTDLQGKPKLGPAIQVHLDKARTYQQQIQAFIRATSDERSRVRLQDLAQQIDEWTQAIEAMGKRIDRFQQNAVIRQDLETVPQSIEKLEARLATETDETLRAELERTLDNRKKQLAALQRLDNTMKKAEIKIESTLASLGTIYSQLLATQSTDHVADYSRLSADVNEEVRTLQDHLEALEEVKLGRI